MDERGVFFQPQADPSDPLQPQADPSDPLQPQADPSDPFQPQADLADAKLVHSLTCWLVDSLARWL